MGPHRHAGGGDLTARGDVGLSGTLICTSEREIAAVERHLPEHTRLSRAEPGCLFFDVWQTDDPMVWRVEERFASRAAFDAHQHRTRASDWWAATAAIQRSFAITGG